MKTFIDDNKIKIRYLYQENGGKHRAINKGLDNVNSELFFIVDSDDILISSAIEIILEKFKTIEGSIEFAGIGFNRGYSETEMIGNTFSSYYIDCTNLERGKNNILGDKSEIYITEILRKIKFPEIEGENFMSEVVLWNEIARQGYKLRWFNEIIYICNYLEDGLTINRNSIYKRNPIAHKMMVRELLQIDVSIKSKIMEIYNYFIIWKEEKSIKEIASDLNISRVVLSSCIMLLQVREIIRRK